jgi:hypothetical protein
MFVFSWSKALLLIDQLQDASGLVPASEVERPKSPWTPSYTVTTQGPGISTSDEQELAELPALPPSINASTVPDSVPTQAETTVTVTESQDAGDEVNLIPHMHAVLMSS